VVALAWLLAFASMAPDAAGAATPCERQGDARPDVLGELLPRFQSPWLDEREAALRQLSAAATAARAEAPWREWLRDPSPVARRAAALLLARDPTLPAGEELRAALLSERDAGVAEALLAALSRRPEELAPVAAVAERTGDAAARGRVSRLLRAVALDALTQKMRDGGMPGFYDGQWSHVWKLHPRIADELRTIAHDEGLHLVLRELAVMALHETRDPALEKQLAALILDENEEREDGWDQWRDRSPTLWEDYQHRRFELSRYVRFSLAKAGMTGPILRMIHGMERFLAMPRQQQMIALRGERESDPGSWLYTEYLRGLLFEIGYYYQQFDDYETAERCYREVLGRFPESRACENAHYNLACISAIQGKREQALDHLRKAIERGFNDRKWLLEDGDFASLRADPKFLELVELASLGLADDAGLGWSRRLRRFLPPGVESFFELDPAKQAAVWSVARSELSAAERQRLLDEAPAAQRPFLAELVESR